MELIKLYLSSWGKAFTLKGRASRLEFWLFVCANSSIAVLVKYVWWQFFWDSLNFFKMFDSFVLYWNVFKYAFANASGWFIALLAITLVIGLLNCIATINISARRLHDTNKSAVSLLWWAVPLFGWLFLLILHIKKGTVGDNRFGKVN
ncbi:MAG: DUF805 domain-containing protein [SAR324 cluster bacterium]|nr:DUF805 domain-containing protein [SAR324 cluster bacterium]